MVRVHQVGRKVPGYPGKAQLEALIAPLVAPVAAKYTGATVQRLLGFWLMWQAYDGMDGLVGAGLYSRSGVHRQRQEFVEVFGVEVDEWLPELGEQLRAAGVGLVVSGEKYDVHRGRGVHPRQRVFSRS